MKKIAVFFLLLISVCLVISPPAFAQQRVNPNTIPPSFYYPYAAEKSYENSQKDTLPQPTSIGDPVSIKLGGANLISVVIAVEDSGSADVFLQYSNGLFSSGTIHQVGLGTISNTSAGKLYEFPIRTATVDELGGVVGSFRFIINWAGSGNGNGGAPSTKLYSLKVVWKP